VPNLSLALANASSASSSLANSLWLLKVGPTDGTLTATVVELVKPIPELDIGWNAEGTANACT
jgi:hypothetical protein